MSKEDYSITMEVEEIAEKIQEKFPQVFSNFDVNGIQSVILNDKKSKFPIKTVANKFPFNISNPKVYFAIVYDEVWKDLTTKQKNLAVFEFMCSVPEEGFNAESSSYGKIKKPDIQTYMEMFAVTGGVPNWMENTQARDPLSDEISSDNVVRSPVTKEMVEELDEEI